MISFDLGPELTLIRDSVRKFAAEQIRPRLRQLEAHGPSESDRRAFFELGLTAPEAPEHLGGSGLGMVCAVIVHEELAFGDGGAALALHGPHAAVSAVLELGTEAQQHRLIPRFLEPEGWDRRGAIAYSERWKLRPAGFGTEASKAGGDSYFLRGPKSFVINGADADLLIVFASIDPEGGWDGVSAFAVERPNAGCLTGERHELLGLGAVAVHEIVLEDCRVPLENQLAGGGHFQRATRRFFARLGLANAARQIGLARASYEYALQFTQEPQRVRQTHRPLPGGLFQSGRHAHRARLGPVDGVASRQRVRRSHQPQVGGPGLARAGVANPGPGGGGDQPCARDRLANRR